MDEERYARREERAGRRASFGRDGGLLTGSLNHRRGPVLLLDNMGMIRSRDSWRYWLLTLVAAGLSRILESHRPAAVVWGGMLAAVVALFFLDNLGVVLFDFRMLWPLIVIAFGISMLVRSSERGRLQQADGQDLDGDPSFHIFAVFGGSKRRITSSDFRGGQAFAFCRGCHIDFRGAQMPKGRAVLDVDTILADARSWFRMAGF